jgi:hypothetical protein
MLCAGFWMIADERLLSPAQRVMPVKRALKAPKIQKRQSLRWEDQQ